MGDICILCGGIDCQHADRVWRRFAVGMSKQLSTAEQAIEAERSQLERELWQLIPTTGGIDARTLKITMINHGDCTHCRIALNRHNNSAYEPLIVEGQSLFQCMLIFIRMRRQQISEKGESR